MRVLALDIGDVRVGIASGDTASRIASPVKVLFLEEVRACARPFRLILEDHEPELLVCGLPYSLSGEEGPQAAHIRELAEAISSTCGIPLEFCDERLSSAEAKRILREQGLSEKEMRGKVDSVAASLFLEAWLEAAGPSSER